MVALVEKVLQRPTSAASAAGASAIAVIIIGGLIFLLQPGPPLQAHDDPAHYHVGTLMGSVTATTTFSGQHVYIYGADDNGGNTKLIAILRPDRYGHFGTTLVPGRYELATWPKDVATKEGITLPVVVDEGTTTTLRVDTTDDD